MIIRVIYNTLCFSVTSLDHKHICKILCSNDKIYFCGSISKGEGIFENSEKERETKKCQHLAKPVRRNRHPSLDPAGLEEGGDSV